ncbi:hypothetical protein F5879DRAFT_927907 [Lentinula edodes]|nr:hypothetical protein F5879DRAFT_927907 [Lentinula edodes]
MKLLLEGGLDRFKGWVHRQSHLFPRLRNIPAHAVAPLEEEYPPRDHWIVKSQSIFDKWEDHILRGKQSDARKTRKELFMLDEKKLKHDIFENESASFRDEKGELICVAMRDFCSDRGITTWADRIVLKNVEMEKNIWSAGAISRPAFNWVQNLTKKIPDDEKQGIRYEASSVFAVFWNLVRAHAPREVIDDLEEFVIRSGIYRMDEHVHGGGGEKKYTVPVNGAELTFSGADMAPPSGCICPKLCQDIDPAEKGGPHVQSGMSIVTSGRLPTVFKQFLEGAISERVSQSTARQNHKGYQDCQKQFWQEGKL